MRTNLLTLPAARSLKVRLAIVLGITALTISILQMTVVGAFARQQIRTEKGLLLREIAVQMANRLSQDLANRGEELLFLAKLPRITDPTFPTARRQALLDRTQEAFPFYAWIGVTDTDGNIVVGTQGMLVGKSVAQREWFLEGRKGLHVSDAHDAFLLAKLLPKPTWDDLPLRLLDLSAPVYDDAGNFVGVICAHLSLDWAFDARERMLANLSEQSIDIIVLNRQGKMLLGTPSLRSLSADLTQLPSYQRRRAAAPATQVEVWPNGHPYLTASVTVPDFRLVRSIGWTVMTREPAESAYAPAKHLALQVFGVGITSATLFAALLWWTLSRELNPLERVSAAAELIRRDDLDAPIPRISGHDEIAVFARSLTSLVDTLRERNAALRLTSRVFEESSQGIVITDGSGHILHVNQAFCRITGYGQEEVIGRTPALLKSGRHPPTFYQEMWQSIATEGSWRGEIWNRGRRGRIYPEMLTITALSDESGHTTHYIGLFDDITEKKEYEGQLLRLANFDPLTGLPNRYLLEETARTALGQASATATHLALLFVDLDHFKRINDSLGHAVGDQCLTGVAERLRQALHQGETVARWGGDEFVIILSGADSHAAARVAQRVLDALKPPLHIGEAQYHLSASIGIALYPSDATTVDGLLKSADSAMYHAKQSGKCHYAYFTAVMNTRVEHFVTIDNALRHAVESRELYLVFQPQFDVSTMEMTGIEALLRWRHPVLGEVSPQIFIPIAEETGQILELGQWVFEQALHALTTVTQRRGRRLPLSVNLSARQLTNPTLARDFSASLAATRLPPELLKLEVTESAIIANERIASNTLKALRARGFAISIDDFGVGYSCLSYLAQMTPTEIKIDKSFIATLTSDPKSNAIVRYTARLARDLDISVVAEGVETPEQLAVLRNLSPMNVQGYLLGKPQLLDQLIPPA